MELHNGKTAGLSIVANFFKLPWRRSLFGWRFDPCAVDGGGRLRICLNNILPRWDQIGYTQSHEGFPSDDPQ